MSNPRYPEEFKIQAVNQVTEKKLPVADVAARLGVSTHSLYAWIKRYSKPLEERQQDDDQHAELRRLRAELKRVNAYPDPATDADPWTIGYDATREPSKA
jgi:transposase